MDKRALAITMLSMMALFAAFAYSYFIPTTTFFADIPFTLTTIGYFLSGIAFFGYFAFIPSIFFGLQLGTEKNVAIFLYIIPTLIATYAGAKLGFLLQDDFNKKNNFMQHWKKIALMLVVSICLALIAETVLPMIIELWPKDFMGLSLVDGKKASSLIIDISKLIRR